VVNRLLRDLFYLIEDLDVQPDEFWTAMNYLTVAGRNGEYGLITAGLGLEHFLDLRLDEAEAQAGIMGGTPRTIEGPLYVAGAPEKTGFARIDDGAEANAEVLFMQGQVLSDAGQPVAGAKVEVWHASLMGTSTRTSTPRRASSTYVAPSSPMRRGATSSAASFRWAIACRPTALPTRC